MSLFTPRSVRPRRAIKLRLHQRPAIRIGAVTAGACMIAAAVAGSILQFSFADEEASEDAQAATATPPSLRDGNAAATTPTPPPRSFVYRTCKEVRAAGAYPLRRGEPGYGPHLDRNGNGLACEPA